MIDAWLSCASYLLLNFVNIVSGRDFIAPCKCKGTSKYVHRDCLDHWRAIKVLPFLLEVLFSQYIRVNLFAFQEGFAFAHCTTCKAPYYLRVHGAGDTKWRTLKFRFFVTRDILSIFLAVQLVIFFTSHLSLLFFSFW